jgi:hypothetical protein
MQLCCFGRVWGSNEVEARMEWGDYLRDEAAKYRQLAKMAEGPFMKQEFLELADVCEEVANNTDDRLPSG